jgi:PAT family beta-lactamase induction signal transducer AmpG
MELNKINEGFFKNHNLFLSENPVLRYFTFAVLYIAQGIPEGITFFAIPAWLAMNGKSPMEIASFVAVIGIPWSLKIVAAPLMDRYTILSMGRKRPWVIFGQLGLILSFLCIGLIPDPLNNLNSLMIAGFFISFFGAFQDVATDGMAIDIIPVHQQARANGLMWGSKTVGTALSLVIGTALINTLGFSTAIASMSFSTVFIIFIPILFRERPGEKTLPWTEGRATLEAIKVQTNSWKQIIVNLFNVTILKSSLLIGLAIFVIGVINGLLDTLLPIFTIQELDWTNTTYSEVYSITTVIGGIFGMVFGGALVDFFGKIKMMSIYFVLLILLFSVFAFFPSFWNIVKVVFGFILLYYLIATFLNIAEFATAMHLCWKTIAATQFTLFMASGNIGRSVGSWLVGVMKNSMNWDYVFMITAILPLLALIIIQFVDFGKHKRSIENLEHLESKLIDS